MNEDNLQVILNEIVPLIFTTKGNIPISELEYSNSWEDTETYTKFTETYTYNGEIVKNGSHVYSKISFGTIAGLGG